MHCWVHTWMGDHLWVGKPSQYVTSHLDQLSLPSLRGRQIEYQPVWLGLRWGVFASVGWQITLHVHMLQVMPHCCEMGFH